LLTLSDGIPRVFNNNENESKQNTNEAGLEYKAGRVI